VSVPPRARPVLAFVALAFVLPTPQLAGGSIPWNQGSTYALVRALAEGTAVVDPYTWQSGDLAWFDGHFYSVRAPATAFLTLPAYVSLRALGLPAEGSSQAGESGRAPGAFGMLWALTLVGAALPALLLVLLVRYVVEALEPGFGTAVAVTLGLGTLVLPFASMLFVHALSACLGFAAFVLLWRERRGPPRTVLVAAGGLVAGLAVVAEYPLGLIAVALAGYALARGPRLLRLLAYCAGVVIGSTPLMAYNALAFGSVLHLSYEGAIEDFYEDGTPRLVVNTTGFFGVLSPNLSVARDLLFSARGLLVTSPVLICAIVGLVLMYRKGSRAESLLIGALAVCFLAYNSGYENPFGGWVPGPRFLIPAIPFLAVAVAPCLRRFPLPTLALAGASVTMMVTALVAEPLLPSDDTGRWRHDLATGDLQATVLTWLGAGHGWVAVAPLVAVCAAATLLAWRSTTWPRVQAAGVVAALSALACWGVGTLVVPAALDPTDQVHQETWPLISVSASIGAVAVLAVAVAQRRKI
jgi:hypothetical protein